MKNHEKELPEGYSQAYHINALDKKIGIILNFVAIVIMAAVVVISLIPFFIGAAEFTYEPIRGLLLSVVFCVLLVVYLVLHELAHGIAYKLLTHEKLTFGISWSCAWCGVPNVYVNRRAALIALVAPLITFTVLLLPLTVWLFYVDSMLYITAVLIFAMHLGGCAGDSFMTLLLCFRFRDKSVLVRDTGPEQFIYVKSECRSEEKGD